MSTRRTLRSNKTSNNNITIKSPKRKYKSDDENSSDDDIQIRKRQSLNKTNDNSDSDEDFSNIKKRKSPKRKYISDNDGSSSDSSVGDYLKAADEIDLNSSFFTDKIQPDKPPDFDSIERQIFGDVQRLSDSESEVEDENEDVSANEIADITDSSSNQIPSSQNTEKSKVNFSQLREYNQKLDEAKACIEKYESNKKQVKKSNVTSKKSETNNLEISKLLKIGESKSDSQNTSSVVESDFNSSDDGEMDWEEVEEKKVDENKISIPKEGVQITVQLPTNIRQKSKEVDMMAAIKRRINRVRKENQVYMHKVHLLCWLAHGNFVNSILNDQELMAQALSLIPSEKCYPPKHADMNYLQQIVQWYGKIMKIHEPTDGDQKMALKESLQSQILNKKSSSKRCFVFIFIIILRSLGLQCRLVLSLQCLPLRPPASELCSLSTKDPNKKDSKSKSSSKPKDDTSTNSKPSTSKSSSDASKTIKKVAKKSTKNSNLTASTSKTNPVVKISQVDGANDDDDDDIISNSKSKSSTTSGVKSKANIKIKLKKNLNDSVSSTELCSSQVHKVIKQESNKNHLTVDNFLNYTETQTLQESSKNSKTKTTSTSSRSPSGSTKNTQTKSSNSKEAQKSTKTLVQGTKNSEKRNTKSSVKNETSEQGSKDMNGNKTKSSEIRETSSSRKKPSSSHVHEKKVEETTGKSKSTRSKSNEKPKKSPVTTDRKASTSKSKRTETKKPPSSPRKETVVNDIVHLIKGRMLENRQAENSIRKQAKKSTKYEDSDYDSDYFPAEEEKEMETVGKTAKKKSTKARKSRSSVKNINNGDDDDDFVYKVHHHIKRRKKPISDEIDYRLVSSDEEPPTESPPKKTKIGHDVWIEVFLEEEEKWISADVIKGQIHCVSELHNRATQPVSYIVAWNNNLSLKDVTARYCPNWNTVTRKLRVDSLWWNESLRPFIGVKTVRDKDEDEDLARQQLDKPLPTTINEYKNHPLYVLQRHLLKFEAIYPPDAVTLGFVRNEPVYARECVHTLHSREIWVKHAKVVKPNQQPYKIVKARPKYDKLTGNVITDLPLEIFGSWQVEDYIPPTAENGIVPRNAFGNVELFKACMLPKKTVHLQLPGLNRIAKKLQIDCAPAVVGFDFHCGGSHPMFDGFVVCEEFEDVLIDAWEKDRDETAKKEQEKIDKRVWGNWRKLIKGLLIRERLKARYNFGSEETKTEPKKKSSKKTSKPAVKKSKVSSNKNKDDEEWTDIE